jgi:mannose-1-phosphate guanylyltransferase
LANNFYPVILAGGRGTRFWPLSRKRRAKQLLPLNSKKSMIQETVERLLPLAKGKQFWVITNDDLRAPIVRQLKKLDKRHILAEPVGRNTAPAIGLAAFLLERRDPAAVLGLFPSDHVISDEKKFRRDIERAVEIAAAGENIVVIGIKPTRAETGYGYIEVSKSREAAGKGKRQLSAIGHRPSAKSASAANANLKADSRELKANNQKLKANGQELILNVRRFTEKPNADVAEQFVRAGNFFWNSGMFIWGAKTLADALREHLPNTAPLLEEIAASYGTRKFEKTFAKLYPKCENISVDYAVLEPRSAKGEGRSGIYCIPASFGWNDLGSWAALYEHRNSSPQQAQQQRLPGSGNKDGANVIVAEESFTLNAEGNFIHTNGKFVAVVGVQNLVVVETDDALLITTREHSQDVGKVVKHLDEKKMKRLV